MPILMWKHNVARFTKVLACAITKEGVWGSKAVVRLSISQAVHLNTVACQRQVFSHFIYLISSLPGYELLNSINFKPCQNQSAKGTAYNCLITMRADRCEIFYRDHSFIFDEVASDSQALHKQHVETIHRTLTHSIQSTLASRCLAKKTLIGWYLGSRILVSIKPRTSIQMPHMDQTAWRT